MGRSHSPVLILQSTSRSIRPAPVQFAKRKPIHVEGPTPTSPSSRIFIQCLVFSFSFLLSASSLFSLLDSFPATIFLLAACSMRGEEVRSYSGEQGGWQASVWNSTRRAGMHGPDVAGVGDDGARRGRRSCGGAFARQLC